MKRTHQIAVKDKEHGWRVMDVETVHANAFFAVRAQDTEDDESTVVYVITHMVSGLRVPGWAYSKDAAIRVAEALLTINGWGDVTRDGDKQTGVTDDMKRAAGRLITRYSASDDWELP